MLLPRICGTPLACLALFALGCGSEPEGPASPNPAQEIGCANDARALTYAPGISVSGRRFRFVLEQADPTPPARGMNRWTLRVLDADTPVSDVALEVVPFMPDHNHGPVTVPGVEPAAGERFNVEGIDFFMPGLWRVSVTARQGDLEDTGEFYFCIAG